ARAAAAARHHRWRRSAAVHRVGPICGASSHANRQIITSSAPNPKFAHSKRQIRSRTSGSEGGTRIIKLLVVLGFRSSSLSLPQGLTNFGIGPLVDAHRNTFVVIVCRSRRKYRGIPSSEAC